MAIVMQYDKRSGITYAYESHLNWGSPKKIAGSKRTLIGQLDRATGQIVPIGGWPKETPKPAVTNTEPPNVAAAPKETKTAVDTTVTSRRIKDIQLACERLKKRSESQQQLAETLQNRVEALNEPLKDLKFHLDRFSKLK